VNLIRLRSPVISTGCSVPEVAWRSGFSLSQQRDCTKQRCQGPLAIRDRIER
jgi:hypothetical protein